MYSKRSVAREAKVATTPIRRLVTNRVLYFRFSLSPPIFASLLSRLYFALFPTCVSYRRAMEELVRNLSLSPVVGFSGKIPSNHSYLVAHPAGSVSTPVATPLPTTIIAKSRTS